MINLWWFTTQIVAIKNKWPSHMLFRVLVKSVWLNHSCLQLGCQVTGWVHKIRPAIFAKVLTNQVTYPCSWKKIWYFVELRIMWWNKRTVQLIRLWSPTPQISITRKKNHLCSNANTTHYRGRKGTRKESDVFKEIMTNYDVQSWHVLLQRCMEFKRELLISSVTLTLVQVFDVSNYDMPTPSAKILEISAKLHPNFFLFFVGRLYE